MLCMVAGTVDVVMLEYGSGNRDRCDTVTISIR